LFEETATALAELTAELAPGAEVSTWEDVTVEGHDLAGLAYAWLNELIALMDIHRAGIVAVSVDRLERVEPDLAWGLHARVGLRPYAEGGVRPRSQAKAATYHGLAVERGPDGWTLRAYLDV
jgi:SHS2 domain-containing protein